MTSKQVHIKPSAETKKKIAFVIGTKCTLMKSIAYVKIFLKGSDGKEWINSTLEGYLCLIFSRNFKAPVLRVYHPVTCQCLFDCAMNYNFNKLYIRKHELFHYFFIPHGCVGFSFADATQAKDMGKLIKKHSIK